MCYRFWVVYSERSQQELIANGEEIGEAETEGWYLRRLDAGLFTLQGVDYILAWVCMEDDGVSPQHSPPI